MLPGALNNADEERLDVTEVADQGLVRWADSSGSSRYDPPAPPSQPLPLDAALAPSPFDASLAAGPISPSSASATSLQLCAIITDLMRSQHASLMSRLETWMTQQESRMEKIAPKVPQQPWPVWSQQLLQETGYSSSEDPLDLPTVANEKKKARHSIAMAKNLRNATYHGHHGKDSVQTVGSEESAPSGGRQSVQHGRVGKVFRKSMDNTSLQGIINHDLHQQKQNYNPMLKTMNKIGAKIYSNICENKVERAMRQLDALEDDFVEEQLRAQREAEMEDIMKIQGPGGERDSRTSVLGNLTRRFSLFSTTGSSGKNSRAMSMMSAKSSTNNDLGVLPEADSQSSTRAPTRNLTADLDKSESSAPQSRKSMKTGKLIKSTTAKSVAGTNALASVDEQDLAPESSERSAEVREKVREAVAASVRTESLVPTKDSSMLPVVAVESMVIPQNQSPRGTLMPPGLQAGDHSQTFSTQTSVISMMSEGEPEVIRRGQLRVWLSTLIASTHFELLMGFVIISNSIFMGVEIDHTARHPTDATPTAFYVVGHSYTTVFTIELVLRLIADGGYFFCRSNLKALMWNYLDLLIVLSSIMEVVLDIMAALQTEESSSDANAESGDDSDVSMSNLRIIRIVRVSRLMRIFRIGRIVRFVSALRTLVFSILSTLRSVFWSMLLLTIIIYVFGILFTQAVGDYRVQVEVGGAEPQEMEEELLYHYGTLLDSMLSLFMAISGGVSWIDILKPLRIMNLLMVFVFLMYITFTYFAVLNVIVGIFCQSAIESTQSDQETMIQAFLANQSKFTKRFKLLFKTIDADGSGFITKEEFMANIQDPKVQAYFATLDLDARDAIALFAMLDDDKDDDRGIDVEDFVNGCLRLKGPAKSYDTARLMSECKAIMRTLTRHGRILEIQSRIICGQTPIGMSSAEDVR